MSNKFFCDVCNQQQDFEGSRHIELKIEGRVYKWITSKVLDDEQKELDICKTCWRILFNLKAVQSLISEPIVEEASLPDKN